MKKAAGTFLTLFFAVLILASCAKRYGAYDPEDKSALRTLAGGAVGALVAGNAGGVIVGALVVDIYNVSTIKYEDKKIESGEEAAKRYKDKFREVREKKDEERKAEKVGEKEKQAEKRTIEEKAQQIKEEDKKTEEEKKAEKREENRKAEQKKADDRKVEQEKEEKKAEETKEEERKAEKRKAEQKSVKLFIENSSVVSQSIRPGSSVEADIQYMLLSSDEEEHVKIVERRFLSTANKIVEIDNREVFRTQGTYLSRIKFRLPEEVTRGYWILFTTISVEKHTKSAKSVLNIF